MADIVRGIVDGIDMGEPDEADDEQSERHGQDSLENHAEVFTGNFTGNRQIGGVRLLHDGSPQDTPPVSSRSRSLALFLIIHVPDHVAAGEMKIASLRDIFPDDLGSGSGAEGSFVETKKGLAISRLRTRPQQRSKGQPMHHADAAMADGLESERIDIVAPAHGVLVLSRLHVRLFRFNR
jgi:hypothetical protein